MTASCAEPGGVGPSRRYVLGAIGGALSATVLRAAVEPGLAPGETLPPWRPGMLDIHHISTGRGNCALFVFPDGTSAMVDAGDMRGEPQFLIDPKPDASRRPGEWMGRYARRHLQAAGLRGIDYFVLTHHHEDHFGWVLPDSPRGPAGAYRLAGVTDVAQIVPIGRFLDRDPAFSYPVLERRESALNYKAFLEYQSASGRRVERFEPGRADQIALLRSPAHYYGDFQVRNLVANGEVWTGFGTNTRRLFPDLAALRPEQYPTENMCSVALRVSYGRFDYYTGGDLTCFDDYGAAPWRDVETPVAQVAGPVEVAVVNHHGYYDADGPGFVRALRPRTFIIEAWDSAHPVVSTLQNMESKLLYPEDRSIFATAMKVENRIANKDVRNMMSANGHIVVRVAPGGASYHVIVTTNQDESDRVTATYGPISCT